jgi:hypothetical protein
MLKIEFDTLDCQLQSRVLAGKEGKPSRTMYWQVGYMYTGGRYPVQVQIGLEEGQPAYPAGEYFLHPSSFQTDSYNKPELKKFGLVLSPISEINAFINNRKAA